LDKERLDIFLVRKGHFQSREKARAAIIAGAVHVNGIKAERPSHPASDEHIIEIRENVHPYVSRGGLKLHKAIEVFNISLKDRVCIDIGASTGGFTHCMLKNGAALVYAVDVGKDQLAKELREDKRVVSMESTDIRTLDASMLNATLSFGSVDVSFISLKKVLPHAKKLFSGPFEMVCLIKPQFEAGKGKIGKNGVVKDKKVHHEVLTGITDFCHEEVFFIKGLDFSPIKGPEGNIEYLLHLSSHEALIKREECSSIIKKTVEEAFKT